MKNGENLIKLASRGNNNASAGGGQQRNANGNNGRGGGGGGGNNNEGGADGAEWNLQDIDRFSFDDSDRFEEDSLCSWTSEPESLCNNWRGWKKLIPNVTSTNVSGVPTSTAAAAAVAAALSSASRRNTVEGWYTLHSILSGL